MHITAESVLCGSPKMVQLFSRVAMIPVLASGPCRGQWFSFGLYLTLWLCNLCRLIDDEGQNELPTPYCIFSDHTLPVTDIICGMGLFPTCRVLTSSVDHSVKVRTVIADLSEAHAGWFVALGSLLLLPLNDIPIPKANLMHSMGCHRAYVLRGFSRSGWFHTPSEPVSSADGSLGWRSRGVCWRRRCYRYHESGRGRSKDPQEETNYCRVSIDRQSQ